MDLQIRQATDTDISEARHWQQASGGLAYGQTSFGPEQGSLQFDTRSGWVAILHGELVAYASLAENEQHAAHIGFIVKPSRRREGIAKAFIPQLLERPETRVFTRIIGELHAEDVAAQKILERAGFHRLGANDNGLVVYERR